MFLFPKVTTSKREFLEYIIEEKLGEKDEVGLPSDAEALSSSEGIIWLSRLSIKLLLHEFLHIVGWKCNLPTIWHWLIEETL